MSIDRREKKPKQATAPSPLGEVLWKPAAERETRGNEEQKGKGGACGCEQKSTEKRRELGRRSPSRACTPR